MKNRCGVTLTEILITLVVLAAVAALAIPSYNKAVEQARANEAKTYLQIIYAGEKIRESNGGGYWATPLISAGDSMATLNNELNVDLQPSQFYNFTITATNPAPPATPTFTALAIRAGAGQGGRRFTINQDAVKTGDW